MNPLQSKEVLEGEVPKQILDQLDILRKTLLENKTFSEEFAISASEDKLHKLDEDIFKSTHLLNEQKSRVNKERSKISSLADKVVKDGRMAAQVSRRHEMLTKNPQYGRMQAMEYMHDIAGQHEHNLQEYQNTLAKLESVLSHLVQDNDGCSNMVYEKELCDHIKRFDEIFTTVANQVYSVNEEVERVKDNYLEQRSKLYGRYASDPFQRQANRDKKVTDVFSNLKGIDAFPSQSAILSMSQFMPKQSVMQPNVPTFGAPSLTSGINLSGGLSLNAPLANTNTGGGGSLFYGPATKHPSLGNAASGMGSSTTPFAFNNPSSGCSVASTQQSTVFGKLSAGAVTTSSQPASLFGSPAAPAFGTQPVAQPFGGVNQQQPFQLQQPPASSSTTTTAFGNKPTLTSPTPSNFALASTPSMFGTSQNNQQRFQQPASNFQTQMHNAGGTLFQSSTKPLFGKQ